jgi:hypothetical protein
MKNLINNRIIILINTILINLAYGQDDIAITITNSNLGLIKETRILELEKGIHQFHLEDIPAQIEPTSVLVESEGSTFNVIEQNFEFDLISVDKILNKFLDKEIQIIQPDQNLVSGKLMSSSGSDLILLDGEGNLQIVPRSDGQKILLKNYSENESSFITKPTLVWMVKSNQSGKHKCRVSYLSNGLDWHADYVGRLNDEDTEIDLACWVTLENRSGKNFKDARLKLIAGEMKTVTRGIPKQATDRLMAFNEAEPAFEQQDLFEYKSFKLNRRTDLKNNQIKQIQLFPETNSKIDKSYLVTSQNPEKPAVIINMLNSEKNNLGFPLPGGKIRLYKGTSDDMEFIGENLVKHTPKDEKIEIEVGNAFDISSERKILKTERPTKRSQIQNIEYSIRNHKNSDIEVEVQEIFSLYQQVELISSNFKPVETQAGFIKFKIPVKKNNETNLTLEYKTNW